MEEDGNREVNTIVNRGWRRGVRYKRVEDEGRSIVILEHGHFDRVIDSITCEDELGLS